MGCYCNYKMYNIVVVAGECKCVKCECECVGGGAGELHVSVSKCECECVGGGGKTTRQWAAAVRATYIWYVRR